MGLLEKAGNVQTEEKKATDVVKAEKEAAKFNKAVAKAAKKEEPSPKESKKAAKVKKAKKAKKVKTPRAKKEPILKEFPDGFDEVNKSRSWFRTLVDLAVNFSLFSFYLLTNIVAGGASDLTYVLILSLILPIFNLVFMPYKTGRTVGQWITTTRYVNSRGKKPTVSLSSLEEFSSNFLSFWCRSIPCSYICIYRMDHWNDRSSYDSTTYFLSCSSRLAIQEVPSTIFWDMGIPLRWCLER